MKLNSDNKLQKNYSYYYERHLQLKHKAEGSENAKRVKQKDQKTLKE